MAIPKKTSVDTAHGLIKAALGSIPVVGSAASEIFQQIVQPPLEKRREEWMTDVTNQLLELHKNNRIDITELIKDDLFIDTILQTTTFVLRTSQTEKKEYLKNALLNMALSETPDITKTTVFLNLIDRFTIWHIKILDYLSNPRGWYRKAHRNPPNSSMGTLSSTFSHIFPELKGEDALIEMIFRDLKDAGFHRTGDVNTTMSEDGLMADRTTSFGNEFLRFISKPG